MAEPGDNQGQEELSDADKLRQQLEDQGKELAQLRQQAQEAQRRLADAEKVRQTSQESLQDSQIAQVSAAIDTLNSNMDIYEQQIEQASAEGNHRLVASLNRKMGEASAQKLQLETGKQAMEAAKANPPAPPQGRTGPDLTGVTDPAEYAARQVEHAGYHRSARWLRNNPQMVRNQKNWGALQTVHQLFMHEFGEDKVDTDDYFRFVEGHKLIAPHLSGSTARSNGHDTTNDNAGDDTSATSGAAKGAERKGAEDRPMPAAPVDRSNGASRGVRLTPAEQEAARDSGLTDEEYAENKKALLAAERMGPKHRTH